MWVVDSELQVVEWAEEDDKKWLGTYLYLIAQGINMLIYHASLRAKHLLLRFIEPT